MSYETVQAADGGSFSAYLAAPAQRSGPAIVVIQEIFGVNHVMRDICDALAQHGYFAICPDLFWRQEPGVDITDRTEEEWGKAFELYQGFNEARGVDDLIATLGFMRGYPGCTGRVGSLGYCLGGKLAYLMATRSDSDCSVAYYGVAIERALDEASAITKPLLLHLAEKDQFVSPDAQAQIRSVLGAIPTVTIYTYPGMDHAFARPGGAHYDKAAADLANDRTAEFFKANLF